MRKTIYAVLATLILILAFLPYLLSVPPFKQLLIAKFEAKTVAKIKIDTLRFSWLGPQLINGINISNEKLTGNIQQVVLKTPFWKVTDYPYPLSVTNGNFQVHDSIAGSIEQINAVIDGSKVDASGVTSINNLAGNFAIQGTVTSPEQFNLTFRADQMPTDPIDCLLGAKGDLLTMLGSSFYLKGAIVNSADSGNLNINLSSQTAKAVVKATFTPTYLTLDIPLTATAPIPPSISKKLIKNGLLLKDPVSIYISNNSFFLPRPFSLSKLLVGAASIGLGRIVIPKPAGLKSLSTFLKTPKLADPNQLEICLTPADFSLNEGLLKLNRVDALLDRTTHLCAWGKINLISENLNMILGVPADTLSSTLILANPSADFVLQIPVSGTLNNPKFDTVTATAQIAASIAGGTVEKIGGKLGAIGGLVGKTVNRVVQPEATPPQKYPLRCP